MLFSKFIATFALIAGLANAAPKAKVSSFSCYNSLREIFILTTSSKRDLVPCQLIAEWDVSETVGGGGPGQSPVFSSGGSIALVYVNGPNIKGQFGNPIQSGDPVVYHTADTNLPQDLTYANSYSTGSFSSCHLDYEDQHVDGTPSADCGSGAAGENCAKCTIDFMCESGIQGD